MGYGRELTERDISEMKVEREELIRVYRGIENDLEMGRVHDRDIRRAEADLSDVGRRLDDLEAALEDYQNSHRSNTLDRMFAPSGGSGGVSIGARENTSVGSNTSRRRAINTAAREETGHSSHKMPPRRAPRVENTPTTTPSLQVRSDIFHLPEDVYPYLKAEGVSEIEEVVTKFNQPLIKRTLLGNQGPSLITKYNLSPGLSRETLVERFPPHNDNTITYGEIEYVYYSCTYDKATVGSVLDKPISITDENFDAVLNSVLKNRSELIDNILNKIGCEIVDKNLLLAGKICNMILETTFREAFLVVLKEMVDVKSEIIDELKESLNNIFIEYKNGRVRVVHKAPVILGFTYLENKIMESKMSVLSGKDHSGYKVSKLSDLTIMEPLIYINKHFKSSCVNIVTYNGELLRAYIADGEAIIMKNASIGT